MAGLKLKMILLRNTDSFLSIPHGFEKGSLYSQKTDEGKGLYQMAILAKKILKIRLQKYL